MKSKLVLCGLLLLNSSFFCYAMEDFPERLKQMCTEENTAQNEWCSYHCSELEKYFHCAKLLNSTERCADDFDYCNPIMGYNCTNTKETTPHDRHITKHVTWLCENSRKNDLQNPQDVVKRIKETREALHSFEKGTMRKCIEERFRAVLHTYLPDEETEYLPEEVKKMCENGSGRLHDWSCYQLKQFFFCAQMAKRNDPDALSYCNYVSDYSPTSDGSVRYHVERLCKESDIDDPKEIVGFIERTIDALHSSKE